MAYDWEFMDFVLDGAVDISNCLDGLRLLDIIYHPYCDKLWPEELEERQAMEYGDDDFGYW